MSFSVDAVIRNTLQMNWIPMAGRIACTAATIEFATRMIANLRRADRLSQIPGVSNFLFSNLGNNAASLFDRVSKTKIAPETLARLFLKNLSSAICFGLCARNRHPGQATLGLAALVFHTAFAKNPLVGWHKFARPMKKNRALIFTGGAIALAVGIVFKTQLQPYINLLK